MSGASQNLEIVYAGSITDLDILFHAGVTADLVDPDAIPTWSIRDPDNVVIATGQGSKLALGHWVANYMIPTQAALGVYQIVWTASVGGLQVQNNTESFEVQAQSAEPVTTLVEIEPHWLRQVRRVAAVAGLPQFLLCDEDVKQYCVFPALHEYFKKFPLRDRQEYAISSELVVPFPDNKTYGATDCRIVEKVWGTNGTGSSFLQLAMWQSINPSYKYRSYGTRYNYNGAQQQAMMELQKVKTLSNQLNTFKYFVNYEEKQIEAYSTTQAKLVIEWAKWSTDFADVRFAWREDVITLAQSYLLNYYADAGSLIIDGAVDKGLNVDALRTRAQELWSRVMSEKFNVIPDTILIRMQ